MRSTSGSLSFPTRNLGPARGRAETTHSARPRPARGEPCREQSHRHHMGQPASRPLQRPPAVTTRWTQDRYAAGHRLQHGESEPLIQRGIHEAARSIDERRPNIIGHVAETRKAPDALQPLDVASDLIAPPAVGADDDQRAGAGSPARSRACKRRSRFFRGSRVPMKSS